jgi:hypothetical protein
MDEDDEATASAEFNDTIREQYARTVVTVEADAEPAAAGGPNVQTSTAEGGDPFNGTNAGEADFGNGVRRAVATPTSMKDLLRAARRGVT